LEAKFSPVKRVDAISEDGTGFSISLDVYDIMKMKNFPGIRNARIRRNGDEEEVFAEVGNKKVTFKLLKGGLGYILLEDFNFKDYVRLEITDQNGRKAWTNPVLL
ncbi:MAG: hypothetical protein ACUVQY_03220, partial [Thermoproteota archaeon]